MDRRQKARGLGLQQKTQKADSSQAKLNGDLVSPAFVQEDSIRVYLQSEGECRSLTRIESASGEGQSGYDSNGLAAYSVRQFQTGESWAGGNKTLELDRNLRRTKNLVNQEATQIPTTDPAEIDENRSIRNDDHLGKRSFNACTSSASICSV